MLYQSFKKEHLKLDLPFGEEKCDIALHLCGNESSKRVLLCLHGLARNGRDFDLLAQEMAKTHLVISLDFPGRGASSWFENSKNYSVEAYVKIVEKILRKFKGKTIDVVGTSMGGIITILMQATQVCKFNKIVLNDIGPFIPGEALTRIAKYVGQIENFENENAAMEHLKKNLADFGVSDEVHWQHLLTHGYVQTAEGFQQNYDPKIATTFEMEAGKEMQDIEFWEIWESFKAQKCLILRGGNSDILLAKTAQKMSEKENCIVKTIGDVGHAPALMSKDQISLIKDFLA